MYVGSGVEPRCHVRTCGASARGTSDDGTTATATRHLSSPFRLGLLVERLVATVLGAGPVEKADLLSTAPRAIPRDAY